MFEIFDLKGFFFFPRRYSEIQEIQILAQAFDLFIIHGFLLGNEFFRQNMMLKN